MLRALLQNDVQVVQRLDALTQQFESDLGLLGGLDDVFKLLELGDDGVDLALEVDLTLRDGRDLDLAGAQALRDRALLAETSVALLARDRGSLLKPLEFRGGRRDALSEHFEDGSVLGGAVADVGDAAIDALGLGVERRELLLEATDLLEHRIVLAGERRDLLREFKRVLLGSAQRFLGVRETRLGLSDGGTLGDHEVVELVDATLTGEYALRVGDLGAQRQLAARPDDGAVGCREARARVILGRRREGRLYAVDHEHVAEQRLHSGPDRVITLQFVEQSCAGRGHASQSQT